MSVEPGPAAARLEQYHMLAGTEEAADAWRRYVAEVRLAAEDDDDPFQVEAQHLLDEGLDEESPPELEDEIEEEDPEGFGMDEPAEGEG